MSLSDYNNKSIVPPLSSDGSDFTFFLYENRTLRNRDRFPARVADKRRQPATDTSNQIWLEALCQVPKHGYWMGTVPSLKPIKLHLFVFTITLYSTV